MVYGSTPDASDVALLQLVRVRDLLSVRYLLSVRPSADRCRWPTSYPRARTSFVYEAEVVELEASLPAPGHLVLTDRHSPDWEASVDGEPVLLLRANGVFQVRGGTRRVRFDHRPRLLRASAGAGAATTAACLLLLVLPQGRRRGRTDPVRAARDAAP